MSVATVTGNGVVHQESAIISTVLIVAPQSDSGRNIKATVDAAGGFVSTIVSYDKVAPADLTGPDAGILVLVVEESSRGAAACAKLRLACDLALVIASRNASEQDIVHAFENGADDYIVLPIQPRALGARLKAVLRRTSGWTSPEPPTRRLVAGEFDVRLNEHRALRRGKELDLSAIEFRLLTSLMRRPGQLVTHSQLLAEVWGPQYVDSRNYLRLYVQYLREKIEDDPRNPKFVINEWGVGYRFEPGQAGGIPAAPQAAA
jgi:two-component system KDP operon response regulator KdpE